MPPNDPVIDPVPAAVLAAFPPAADDLLAAAGALVTDDMLEAISEVDYGTYAAEHLEALRRIRDWVRLPSPLEWEPLEVLALTRWSRPSDNRGHVMRAFCCAALLRAAADPANAEFYFIDGKNDTLAPLIGSALWLGRGLPAAAARFITWHFPSLRPSDTDRPFYVFGLLVLAVLGAPDALGDEAIEALVGFTERCEALLRDPLGVCTPDMFEGSFLDLAAYDQNHHRWRGFARDVATRRPDLRRLVDIATRVAGKPPAMLS